MKKQTVLRAVLLVLLAVLMWPLPIQAQPENTNTAMTLTGQLITEQMYAPALEGALLNPSTNRSVSVYLPPDYDNRPNDKFPVVYVLHFGWESPSQFITAIGGKAALDAFFGQDGVLQMLLVFPDVAFKNRYSQDLSNLLTNSSVAGNWQDFITDDLVEYIDSTYRTIPEADSRGVTGLADTGYGVIKLGMLRPDLFQAVYALAPVELAFEDIFLGSWSPFVKRVAAHPENYANFLPDWQSRVVLSECIAYAPDATATPMPCHLPYDSQGALVDSVWQQWLQHDPYTMLTNPEYRQHLLDLEGLAFDCGSRITYNINAARLFDQALTDAGIPHEYKEYEGETDTDLQARVRNDVLLFFADKLFGVVHTATEAPLGIPDAYHLSQNYPNPFNPTTTITYTLPRPADVTLTVYDVLGRQVRVLASGTKPAGIYDVFFDATGLSSGLYFCRLSAGTFTQIRHMVLAK